MGLGDCFLGNTDEALLKAFGTFFLGRDVFELVLVVGFFNGFLAGVDWIFLNICELFFVPDIVFNGALAALGKFKFFLPEVDRGFSDFRLFFMAEDGFGAAAVHFDCFLTVVF